MYYEDFIRLRAQIVNNISKSYMMLKDYDRAEVYNNAALISCPGYARGYLRRTELLEETYCFVKCIEFSK
jgi:hypothetical protein